MPNETNLPARPMPGRPFWKRPPNVFSAFLIVLLGVAYVPPFGDMDYGILIRLGERIVRTGQLRPPEGFSYTIAGSDVPDFEWLFELLVWGLWALFGYGGLKLLKVLLVGATLLILGLRLRREGVRWPGIGLTVLVAVMMTAGGWNLRPMFFTTIGLLLVSGWLHDHCTGRGPLTWWLPVVMLLWANLHPGVITGQGLLAGAIAWEWLNRWVRLNPPLSLAACGRLTLVGGLGLAATFVAPDPVERLLLPFRPELRHPIQRVIVEMQPLWEAALEPPFEYATIYLLAAVIGLTVVLHFRQYRLWEVGLLAGLGVLGNMAIRSTQDWILVMLALGVPHLAVLLSGWERQGRRWRAVRLLRRLDTSHKRLWRSPLFRFEWRWPAAALGLVAVVSLTPPLSRCMPIAESDDYPIRAADWIEVHGLPTRRPWHIFSRPDNGAYLVWRLGDRVRCYADTRTFCYPPEVFADSIYIPLQADDWRGRLERVLARDTEYVLLEKQGAFGSLWRVLAPSAPRTLYEDEQVALLRAGDVRRWLRGLDRQPRAAR